MAPKPFIETKFDDLLTSIYQTNEELGSAAVEEAVNILKSIIHEKGEANIIIATGNSQLTFLKSIRTAAVEWEKVNIFHMDEYIGLDPTHPASFPFFLREHIINFIHPKAFFPVPSSTLQNAKEICDDYEKLLRSHPADLCVLGIGENGHLAFNDPPYADFKDTRWVKIVKLNEVSRNQQVGEGHFKKIDDVPTHAITLTIPALLAAKHILALVPEARKSKAVYQSLFGEITTDCPGSILRQTPQAHLYLDRNSAREILPKIS
jgi:glucosamine-6-phosphate deaminase